jgi:hypothetical protein
MRARSWGIGLRDARGAQRTPLAKNRSASTVMGAVVSVAGCATHHARKLLRSKGVPTGPKESKMKRRVCAVLVTAALAGCGTGGGGSGGPSGPVSPPVSDSSSPPSSDSSSPPASFELPTLSTVRDAVGVSSAITSRPHEHFRDRVSATVDGAGNFTFTVNDPNVGAYTFTVNLPPNSSLNVNGETAEGAFNSLLYSAAGVMKR